MVEYWKHIQRPFLFLKEYFIGVLISFIAGAISGLGTVFLPGYAFSTGLVAAIIVFILVYIVLNLIISGYGLDCALTSMNKNLRLPKWTGFGRLFIRGFLSMIIGIVYSIPLLILLFLVVGLSALTSENLGGFAATIGVGGIILFAALILTVYVLPMAIMNFIAKGFGAGFDFKEVFRKAFTSKYLITLLVVFVYSIVVIVVLSLFQLILAFAGLPGMIITYMIAAFIGMAIQITSMSMYGAVYKEIK